MPQTDLSGRTALVTGASSGFGRHFALVLARHGADVLVAARRLDALEQVVDEINRAGAQPEQCDWTCPTPGLWSGPSPAYRSWMWW